MSNSKNILYLISLMLLMLTGCEADTSWAPLPGEGEEPVEVRLHATTFGASVEVSRTTTLEGTQIGMLGGGYQNLPLSYDSNTKALKRTDQGIIYYPLQTDTMRIYAYAPYSEEAYMDNEDSVKVKNNWESGLTDYIINPIWAKASVTKDNPIGVLTFKHAVSRLQIFLVNERDTTYNDISLIVNFDRSQYGKMSLETGIIKSEKESNDSCMVYWATQNLHSKENTDTPQYDYTILPDSKLQKIQISFEGLEKKYIHEFESSPDFVVGKTNRIFINLGRIKGKPQVNGSLEDFEFENEEI